ncbi:MAG TPA: hypothetical protein PKC98_03165 [Candidatus Melainabacteria bacterium]|nr:hypothetical protein [Candidatus Melainabacteria bacterium]
MKVLHPLRLTAYSNTKLTLCALCGDQERSFEFELEPGTIPVLNGDSSFRQIAVMNADIGSWITRAAASLLNEYKSRIRLSPADFDGPQTVSIEVLNSQKPNPTKYQVSFDHTGRRSRVFEISGGKSSYLLSEQGNEWHGQFNNMRLEIESELNDEDRPLIESIFYLHRAREES